MTTRFNPYLYFRDTAREAMEFYHSVFGGELNVITFAEMQTSEDPAEDNNVMHSQLVTDHGLTLMAADLHVSIEMTPGNNYSIALSGPDEDELRGYWDKLSADGTVLQPIETEKWGDDFGKCVDRFGVTWLVNIEGEPPSA
jgi:PhnB protein